VTALVPRLILRPLQSFRRTEEACGILLLAIAVAALVSATSPWRPT
jgi:Na+/H+ antiporter NhaA